MYSPGFPDRHPEHVAEDLRIGAAQPKHPGGRTETMGGDAGFDSFDRLPGMDVPTLVLHRAEDLAVPPENARLLAERIPGAELVLLKGAGTCTTRSRPRRPTPPSWTSSGGTGD